jgi:hypothetical protein
VSDIEPPAYEHQNIETVRKHLFAALAGLSDKANPMAVERARAISEVSNTIVNTARVEIEFAKVSKRQVRAGFIPLAAPEGEKKGPPKPLGNGITGITRHVLGDD